MNIALVPVVTGRRLSLRDAVRMLERAEMLEGHPRHQQSRRRYKAPGCKRPTRPFNLTMPLFGLLQGA